MRIFRKPPPWRKLLGLVPAILTATGLVLAHFHVGAGIVVSLLGIMAGAIIRWFGG